MVIKFRVIKKSIEIKCNPIVPAEFKYKFIEKLDQFYTIKLDNESDFKTMRNLKITDEEKNEYLKFYKQNNFKYSFDEFLQLAIFPIGSLEVFSKENNEKIAFIDFVPDGDVNMIWIDVFEDKFQNDLIKLINDLISRNCFYEK